MIVPVIEGGDSLRIYVVQSGDTLWQISQVYGVPWNQIAQANGLTDPNTLVVGQSLVIPPSASIHIVRAGETLWSIAQRYGVTIESLILSNQITNPSVIYVGQQLKLPTDFHTVQQGDSLWAISNQYGVSVQLIAYANRIQNPSLIYPGQRLIIPGKQKVKIEVNAYSTFLNESGQQTVKEIGQYLTYITPFSYQLQQDGTVRSLQDDAFLRVSKEKGVAPLMVLTNFEEGEFSSELAHTVLNSANLQENLINNMLQILSQKGYRGLNIDFEYLYPSDKEAYNEFLRNVVNRLRPLGYSVSTAIAPKYSRNQKGLLYEAHDYRAHGEIVDFVVIMTYEWGWSGGPPMAVAPLSEVKKVIQYALTEMPKEKIMMGMPLYGYDWTLPYVEGGKWAKTLSPQQAVERAAQNGVAIQFDEKAQSPYYEYTDRDGKKHIVWFEDARSVKAKYNLVEELGLRGVSYWVLGNPFPQNWLVLHDQFNIQKF